MPVGWLAKSVTVMVAVRVVVIVVNPVGQTSVYTVEVVVTYTIGPVVGQEAQLPELLGSAGLDVLVHVAQMRSVDVGSQDQDEEEEVVQDAQVCVLELLVGSTGRELVVGHDSHATSEFEEVDAVVVVSSEVLVPCGRSGIVVVGVVTVVASDVVVVVVSEEVVKVEVGIIVVTSSVVVVVVLSLSKGVCDELVVVVVVVVVVIGSVVVVLVPNGGWCSVEVVVGVESG